MENKSKDKNTKSKEYLKKYLKENYVKPTIRFKPDFYRKIEEYCQWHGLKINEFFSLAAKFIIDEKIDLNGYKQAFATVLKNFV